MNIFEDYGSWKYENHELIKTLVSIKSKTITRCAHVLTVVDYLYEQQMTSKDKISEDEELIFSTGYDYVYDQFQIISSIYEFKFQKNAKEMEKYAKTINLLLYINEFQGEVLNSSDKIKDKISLLDDLEDKVNKCLDAKENAPEEYFILLNDINYKIFEENGIEVHTVDQIFYEIAVELGIYSDDEYDAYNDILNKVIDKHRKENIKS